MVSGRMNSISISPLASVLTSLNLVGVEKSHKVIREFGANPDARILDAIPLIRAKAPGFLELLELAEELAVVEMTTLIPSSVEA